MREILRFRAAETVPRLAEVLESQDLPGEASLSARVRALLDSALRLYAEQAEPVGVYEEIDLAEFERVYQGEGKNAPETPLAGIFPRAESLALFVATVGEPVTARIAELFEKGELPLSFLLDAVASTAADQLALQVGSRYLSASVEGGRVPRQAKVLPYSPGYCGWDTSGQKKLFERLRPEEIGITLNPSCLMQPLKSVSGVLVAGPAEIHRFRANFPFCETCEARECGERMASVLRG